MASPILLPLQPRIKTIGFFMKFINKQLNADAQEPASTETVDQAAAATTTTPEAVPVIVTAHDDFDWSIDKRNVSHYSENDRVKYD